MRIKKFLNNILPFIVAMFFCFVISCSKSVEADLSDTELTGDLVFRDDATATAAMLGVYSEIMAGNTFANGEVNLHAGLMADELVNFSLLPSQSEFAQNSMLPSNERVNRLWASTFFIIYQANAIIEGVQQSSNIKVATKNQLTGEAKFIRALCYHYLVQLFGRVPLVLSTSYPVNATISQSNPDSVYQQIRSDLRDAIELLPADFSMSNNERTRPNRFAALALMARVQLYLGNWQSAVDVATEVLESDLFTISNSLNEVFLANSSEAIWQLQPVLRGLNTREGGLFIISGAPSEVALSETFLAGFESGDLRRASWVGEYTGDDATYFYPYKYKVANGSTVTEYHMAFRLAELYLVRAEARAHTGLVDGPGSAAEDINVIRTRAGLGAVHPVDTEEALGIIAQERKSELFAEWGHRWFDLKRTGAADGILSALKAPGWQITDTLLPIPQSELLINKNLHQNKGY